MLKKIVKTHEDVGLTVRMSPKNAKSLNDLNRKLSARLMQEGFMPLKGSELVHYFIETSINDFDIDKFIRSQKDEVK
jgi:hypothetical protein